MNPCATISDDEREALWMAICRDRQLVSYLETLPGRIINDAIFQLLILTKLRKLLEHGTTTLGEIIEVATRHKRLTEFAEQRWNSYLNQFKRSSEKERDQLIGALTVAGNEYRELLRSQPPNIYLDDSKIGSKGPGRKNDIKALNGWAIKLVAARLPAALPHKAAIINRLLCAAGFAMGRCGRQRVEAVLRSPKPSKRQRAAIT